MGKIFVASPKLLISSILLLIILLSPIPAASRADVLKPNINYTLKDFEIDGLAGGMTLDMSSPTSTPPGPRRSSSSTRTRTRSSTAGIT